MLQVCTAMPTPHDLCHKESVSSNEAAKSMQWGKGRARTHSDDLSTVAPSPQASPIFSVAPSSPLCGPDELLLPDLSDFQLPDAEESSEAEFVLFGFDQDESTGADFELSGFQDDKDGECTSTRTSASDPDKDSECCKDIASDLDEDVESQLLDLLSELASLRAQTRQQHREESDSSLQKIPYPQLESGFLPAELMPMHSSLVPSGHAATGKWACAMAPRPSNDSMEPLNIIVDLNGATLTAVSGYSEECWSECKQILASKAKAVFRRRRGRSRSPCIPLEEMAETHGPRGRHLNTR